MWIVLKYKSKEKHLLQKKLKDLIGANLIFFNPKLKIEKFCGNKRIFLEKNLLEDYLICHSKEFLNRSILHKVKFTQGVKYLLENFIYNQKDIINFIKHCKNFEENGFINTNFFKDINFAKGQFISGPFRNLIFEVLERNHKNLKVLVGNIKTTISEKSSNSYIPA